VQVTIYIKEVLIVDYKKSLKKARKLTFKNKLKRCKFVKNNYHEFKI